MQPNKKFLILIIFVLLFSCDVTKDIVKNKKESAETNITTTKTSRKGDTIRTTISKTIYKDTTITTINHVGTQIRTIYDEKGRISIECLTSEINELKQEYRNLIDKSKQKEVKKEWSFDTNIVIYIVLGFFLIVVFGLIIITRSIGSNTKNIKSLIESLNR